MGFAPSLIVKRAEKEKLTSNWQGAYELVPEESVSPSEDFIGSHSFFKIKEEEIGRKRLKARLCPDGHMNAERFNILNDSSCVLFVILRLILSLCVILKKRVGLKDIKGAYLQSGPITRIIYVRPQPGLEEYRFLWKLTKLPYGTTEAERPWATCFEKWLLQSTKFQRVPGINQLYI